VPTLCPTLWKNKAKFIRRDIVRLPQKDGKGKLRYRPLLEGRRAAGTTGADINKYILEQADKKRLKNGPSGH